MSFGHLKRVAKARLSGNLGAAIIGMLIIGLINGAATSMGLSILVYGPFMVGEAALFMNIWRNGKASYEDVFDGFKDFAGNLVLGLLLSLFVALWTFLFIIPGIIKSYAWALSFYIKKDHPDWSYKQVLDTSASWMKGHKWELFMLQLSFFGWILLCIITLGIAIIYVGPYMSTTMAGYYEYIKGLHEVPNVFDEENKDADDTKGVFVDILN